jgi:hypothetical protein
MTTLLDCIPMVLEIHVQTGFIRLPCFRPNFAGNEIGRENTLFSFLVLSQLS